MNPNNTGDTDSWWGDKCSRVKDRYLSGVLSEFRLITLITVRNEVAKVMFLQVSVHGGGGLLPGGAWTRGVHGPRGCMVPGGLVSQHALRQTPPG